MSWLDTVGELLNRYGDRNQSHSAESTEADFDQLSKVAPREELSTGLAEAFRSGSTPPFPEMLGSLFGNSQGNVRSGVLNLLMAVVGPHILSSILSRHVGGEIASRIGNPGHQLTAEEADAVPASAVREIAEQAHVQDPGIVDRMSDFYSEHPTLVKSLGTAAIGVALSHFAGRSRASL